MFCIPHGTNCFGPRNLTVFSLLVASDPVYLAVLARFTIWALKSRQLLFAFNPRLISTVNKSPSYFVDASFRGHNSQ